MNSLDKISPFMHPQQNPSSKPQTKNKTTQISANDRPAGKDFIKDRGLISPKVKTMGIEKVAKNSAVTPCINWQLRDKKKQRWTNNPRLTL